MKLSLAPASSVFALLLTAACARLTPPPATPTQTQSAVMTSEASHPLLVPYDGSASPAKFVAQVAAKYPGRTVVAYLGAEPCKPCKEFKAALAEGTLPREFDQYVFVGFEVNDDAIEGALKDDGYLQINAFPQFVTPKNDGRGTRVCVAGGASPAHPETWNFVDRGLRAKEDCAADVEHQLQEMQTRPLRGSISPKVSVQ